MKRLSIPVDESLKAQFNDRFKESGCKTQADFIAELLNPSTQSPKEPSYKLLVTDSGGIYKPTVVAASPAEARKKYLKDHKTATVHSCEKLV